MKKLSWLWWLLGSVFAVAVLAYSFGFRMQRVGMGSVAPEVTLTSLEGDNVALSDFRGKRVLLNFWSTTCKPCIEELPALNQLQATYPDELVILAVNQGDSIAKIQAFLETHTVDVPVFVDRIQNLSRTYRVQGLPRNFFIDAEGTIEYVMYGAMRMDNRSFEETMLNVYANMEEYIEGAQH